MGRLQHNVEIPQMNQHSVSCPQSRHMFDRSRGVITSRAINQLPFRLTHVEQHVGSTAVAAQLQAVQ